MLLLVCVTATAQTQGRTDDMNSGIVYGADHAFTVVAPKGWVLDNQAGVKEGLHAVFYPFGSSWAKSTRVMYANTASKKVKGQETLAELMRYDVENFRKKFPKLATEDIGTWETKAKEKARVINFTNEDPELFEAVAYIDAPTVIVVFVLSADSQKEFEDSLPSFRTLLREYAWLASDVHIEK